MVRIEKPILHKDQYREQTEEEAIETFQLAAKGRRYLDVLYGWCSRCLSWGEPLPEKGLTRFRPTCYHLDATEYTDFVVVITAHDAQEIHPP